MPTFARRATSSIWASLPCSEKTARAALRIASRLRRASARSGRGSDSVSSATFTTVGVDKRNFNSVSFRTVTGTQLPLFLEEPPPVSESAPVTHKTLALVLLAAAQFVVVLDASIVNVALPSIGRDLDFSQENLSWVINAYMLTFGGFLLLGGRMADLLGRRRIFVAGLILFSLRLAARRPRADRGTADRRPRPPGPRRRDPLPGRAVDHHDDVRRGRRAQPRAGRLGRGRRLRRRRRRAARRHPDRVRRLGVGPVRQRADRPRRRRARRRASSPRAARPGRALRHRRRDHDHRGPVAARLRARRRRQRRLGLDPDARPARARAPADRRLRRHRAALAGAARPVPDLPQPDADRRQRGRRCWWRCRCSRCSSSSRSTCSRCSATTR